jgi:hypothetical protein
MSETILFTTDRPDFYLLEQIYDSVTNPSGTIIPRPGSLVLDPVNQGVLKRVLSVNESTHNSILGPVVTQLIQAPIEDQDEGDTNITSIIDYGNSLFYLFYDTAETPTKLNIDKKVIILGDDAAFYELTRYDTTINQYVPISLYYDTAGNYNGTKVPLAVIATGINNAKVPTNCHTSYAIEEGVIYHLNIYDYAGTQCGSVKLMGKKALINNVLDDNLIITDFIVEATQQEDNGDFYLFPDQDPLSLVLTPRLVYNNGTTKAVAIDDDICHLYGFEGFTAAYPGQEVEILVKYFLAPSQQAITDALISTANSRSLVKVKTVKVKDPGTNEYNVKILTVPIYIQSTNRWVLTFFLYSLGENVVRNITPNVTVSPVFDGLLMGVDQPLLLTLRIRDIFLDAESDFIYQQPVVIRIAPYSYYERYIIRDSVGDTYGIYGVESPILSRPVLYFDESVNFYFIPTSKFSTKELFLEAFYYKSRPLYDSGSLSEPVQPTHFTIRNVTNGMLLLSEPISVNDFGTGFSIINVDTLNALVGNNCIVEFLRYEQSQYNILFGVPVDVYTGTYA